MRRDVSRVIGPVAFSAAVVACSSVSAVKVAGARAPLDAGVVGAASSSQPSTALARTPFLLWRFEAVARKPDELFDLCIPVSVAWTNEHGQALWSRPVPTRLRQQQVCSPEYTKRARDWIGSPVASGIGAPIVTKDAIALADWGGVWALRLRDGTTIVDHAMEWRLPDHDPPRERFFFDDGTFELDGAAKCTGDARHARVFARCGPNVLFFNGTRAALFDADTWKVVSEGELPLASFRYMEHARSEASMSLGGRTLTLRGRTYLY